MISNRDPSMGGCKTSPWLDDLRRQLRRGKHIILHGNVRDAALYDSNFYPSIHKALDALLRSCNYTLRAQYNLIDGVTFADPGKMKPRFEKLRTEGLMPSGPATEGAYQPEDLSIVPLQRAGQVGSTEPGQNDGKESTASPYLHDLGLALASLRKVLNRSQTELVSAVLSFSDLLFSNSGQALIYLSLLTSEARQHSSGHSSGMRNTLILTAASIGQVPPWLYRDNPYFQLVAIDKPSASERQEFLRRYYHRFYPVQPQAVEPPKQLLDEFAALTDGLTFRDLEALTKASTDEKLHVTKCKQLVDYFKYGSRVDQWKVGSFDVEAARIRLEKQVIGQPSAVQAALNALIRARAGLRPAGRSSMRPKGVLFFVGPTGVGKTELAKAITEEVFHDPTAFERFDMSEYQQKHDAQRLTGAPPSYVGHLEGGQLTNRIKARPFSVLLFDEFEKAHKRVWDKFLQVLSDGRLTDGMGQTVHFSQALIVFTSNIGSTKQGEDGREISAVSANMSPDEVERHYKAAVRKYFTEIRRPELLGRIGDANIIVFNPLQRENLEAIVKKFLGDLRATLKEDGISLEYENELVQHLLSQCSQERLLEAGARCISDLIDGTVQLAISLAVLGERNQGTLWVGVAANGIVARWLDERNA